MSASAISANTFSYYTAVTSATGDALHKGGAFQDIIKKATPTLDRIGKKGKINEDGGRQVAINLLYSNDTNVNSYGELEELDTSRSDGMTTVFDKWCLYHFGVSFSGTEMATNKGKAQIANLVKARYAQHMQSATERLSNDIWQLGTTASVATGNGDKNIKSIPMVVPAFETSSSVRDIDLYGIDTTANDYWQPKLKDFADSATAQGLLDGLRWLAIEVTKAGKGKADLCPMDYQTYNLYIGALDTKVRYTNTKSADTGFESVDCYGADAYPEMYVPDTEGGYNWDSSSWANGSAYFLNTNHLWFRTLSGRDWKPEGAIRPHNQDAVVNNHFFQGQFGCDARDCHGLAFDIPSSLT